MNFNAKVAATTSDNIHDRIRSTLQADGIICLIDNKKTRNLKRYLLTRHNMTEDAYRRAYNLPADYPMSIFEIKRPTPERQAKTIDVENLAG